MNTDAPAATPRFRPDPLVADAWCGFDIVVSRRESTGVHAEVSFSPSPALWVILAIVVLGIAGGWLWMRRSRTLGGPSARPTAFALFGRVTESVLPPGWTAGRIVAIFGNVVMDLRDRPPGADARLRVFHLFGDVRLRTSPGTRVTTGGTTLFGDQRVDVKAGAGPEFEVRTWSLFGDLEVND
jgi:hypothetical protein